MQKINNFLKSHLKEISGLAIFLTLAVVVALVFNSIGIEVIQKKISSSGPWGPLIFIIVHATTIVIAPFEGSFLMIASGSIFGLWQGILYTIIAGYLGSSINFWIARLFGAKLISKLIGKKGVNFINQISQKVNDQPALLIPLMATTLFDLMGYAAGISSIKYQNFMIAVTTSSLFTVPIYVILGKNLIENPIYLIELFLGLVIIAVFYFIIQFFIIKLAKILKK